MIQVMPHAGRPMQQGRRCPEASASLTLVDGANGRPDQLGRRISMITWR